MKFAFIFLLVCNSIAADWYVSPQSQPASTGDGTLANPGSFLVAVYHTNWAASIAAGDTIHLRAGTYTNYAETNLGPWVYFTGTNIPSFSSGAYYALSYKGSSNNFITWKSYTNEWAKIDGLWRFGNTTADWIEFQKDNQNSQVSPIESGNMDNLPTVSTQEQRDAIPSGQLYMFNGQTFRKR